MDPAHRGWPLAQQAGGNVHPSSNAEQNQSRPAFSASQQSPPQGHSGLPPPPPPHSGPFPRFHQQAPSLASLAGISQSSPRQPIPPPASRPEGPPQGLSQGPQLPLPGFSQATRQSGASERDRERAREAEQIHIKEEEDRRHRDLQERQRLEQAPPHQTAQGPPMPLHQPIAVGPRSVHGPNGLLGNPGQPPPHLPLGAPTGPSNVFAGGPVQAPPPGHGPSSQQMQASMLMPFPPNQQPQPTQQQQPNQQQGQGQGQQPILNDALSYLDQVKVQFAEVPDVYNRFLDIMKDFKSGAIDTPGVIGRVSSLFAGNPDLIQGFNTFLPPGYRIECGADNDPNSIRVTTPLGTQVHAMPQPRPLSRQDGEQDGGRPANGTITPQPGQSAHMMFSPSGRPLGPTAPGQQHHMEAVRQHEQAMMHQQEQRGVHSLSNAASAAAGGAGIRAAASPRATPLPGQQDMNVQVDDHSGQTMEKRGPIEFNHAIGYVNKIKNRFTSNPDTYKQFLEILQTYQRESKPIQDVYSQVTELFKSAPDLLEDFKQFLPESAAQAKAAEKARQQMEESVMLSNVRGDGGGPYASPIMSRESYIGTPSHGRSNLPPVGNFAPTPVGKDNKRKRGERQGTVGSTMDNGAGPSAGKIGTYTTQGGKRLKHAQQSSSKGPSDQPPPSPSLIPRLPAPIAPTTTSAATHEELAIFDRAKKAIGNKNTMNEFLKLCNLFSQDLIDRTMLVHRARAFFGTNAEMMSSFMVFIGYDEKDIVIENKAREPIVPGGRISLSNCRGLGPSYRLLPKRERVKKCSGRDELCNSVLNDEWASHPTWASEDSGFIAHRKNVHEEGLHRIEEERHDYDYNIEACSRTIQLLEPIALQLRRMSNEDQPGFKLPCGLGGQSETIYKRVIMKLYGRDKGHDVITQLHQTPYQVIPVLLNRLKERLETWKMAQREWEKVWREQTQKMFWKSLDHQAVNARTNDRKHFMAKTLQAEVQIRLEEQKKEEQKAIGSTRGQPQLAAEVLDEDVVIDAVWLILVYVEYSANTDAPRLGPFIKEFLPLFFGISAEEFERKLAERRALETSTGTAANGEDLGSGAEDSGIEKKTKKNGKQSTLLRQTLDKGPKGRLLGRRDREDSNVSLSRASTPGPTSDAGDDGAAVDGMAVDAPSTGTATPHEDTNAVLAKAAESTQRWFNHPETGNVLDTRNVEPNEQQKRSFYRLWSNGPIYCFIRMFLVFYERLHRLKLSEQNCRDIVRNAKKAKPAIDLGIVDKLPSDFFSDTGVNANYYPQMLHKFYEVLQQDLDFVNDGVEECLRRFYLQAGYPLYAFEKMVSGIAKYGAQVVVQDGGNKERSWEIVNLWKKDKARGDEVNAQQATDYRRGAEKLIGGQETYAVDWDAAKKLVKIYLVKKDDPYATAPADGLSELDKENMWRYYVASYSSIDITDGMDSKQLRKVALGRNMSTIGADPNSNHLPALAISQADTVTDGQEAVPTVEDPVKQRLLERWMAVSNQEDLVLRIALNNYHIRFEPGTAEGFFQPMRLRQGGEEGVKEAQEDRKLRLGVMDMRYVVENEAMKDLNAQEVGKRDEEFRELTGVAEVKVEEGTTAMEVDVDA